MGGSEDDLLLRAVQGDGEALSALLRRYGPHVRHRLHGKIAARWQAVLEVADVMQVTYLEAFLRIRQFRPDGTHSFVAWLHRIAENNVRDSIRALERAKRPDPRRRIERAPGDSSATALAEVLGCTTSTPSRRAGRREVGELVEAAIERLPADYATVIRLYDLQGQSAAEVARSMRRSVGAVYMLRARAHERLRDVLGSESKFFSDSS